MKPHPSFTVAGKRVVVVGAARSGVAAARLLVRRGASVLLTDVKDRIDTEAELRGAGVELELGGHRADTLRQADLIVLSPGVPPGQAAIADARAAGVPVIGELELASRWLRGRIVAITGTKGKSTTSSLTGRMLEAGGHHVLVIEFDSEPGDLARFRAKFDEHLAAHNDDYRAHRSPGAGLPAPEVVVAAPGSFEDWMRARGKLGGQHKVPRMDSTGAITGEILKYVRKNSTQTAMLAFEKA